MTPPFLCKFSKLAATAVNGSSAPSTSLLLMTRNVCRISTRRAARFCTNTHHQHYHTTSSASILLTSHTTRTPSSSKSHFQHRHTSLLKQFSTNSLPFISSCVNSLAKKAYYSTCDICKRTILNGEGNNGESRLDGLSGHTSSGSPVDFSTQQVNDDDDDDIILPNMPNVKKPKRIILMRHGESLANVDKSIHTHTPDYKISLTRNGRMQAHEAGKYLSNIIPTEESVKFWVSPYYRTRETFEQVAKSFKQHKEVSYYEEIRLREQEWGNFQDSEQIRKISQERWRYGPFYYRFPNGESGSDVYDRVSAFLETFHRHFGRQDNMVLISHGLTCRIFLMRWHKWSIKLFHRMQNLENAQCVIMELQPDGKYKITTPLILREGSEIGFPEDDFHPEVYAKINSKSKYDIPPEQEPAYDEFDEKRRYRPFFVSKSPQSLGKLHHRPKMTEREFSPVAGSEGPPHTQKMTQ
mmetsp:Transcript_11311/g.42399  ORF Transcript_11311/g.42399 Transcript_11311/m.42399 type:complete len:467 (-) Transcript_11311:615-2015(-)